MKPFQAKRLDGSPRYRVATAQKSASNRSKATNGAAPYNMRTAPGRRLRDLAVIYLDGLPEPLDEPTVALARAGALACTRLETLECKVAKGEQVNDLAIVRLAGVLSRTLAALAALKEKAKVQPAQPPPTVGNSSFAESPLGRHIRELIAQRPQKPASHPNSDGARGKDGSGVREG
jgi:hypothetical protein